MSPGQTERLVVRGSSLYCPKCGGRMLNDIMDDALTCIFCGNQWIHITEKERRKSERLSPRQSQHRY